MPTLPFQNGSLIATKRGTWKTSTKVAEMFLTSYNEYWTKILNLALKVGVLARELKECGRGLSGSGKKSTNFEVVLVQILVYSTRSTSYSLETMWLS